MVLKTIDLCAGIGGIRRGFELAGNYKNIISAEIDEAACFTYKHLFGDDPKNDIMSESFKAKIQSIRYDILLAGFPCQAFSSVGLQQGFQDTTKGTVFFHIADIIKRTHPKAVFLENVENLLRHNKGKTFKTIVNILENELGYKVVGISHLLNGELDFDPHDFIRNSKDFGIPQNRPRAYIVCFSKAYFGEHLAEIPEQMPVSGSKKIYGSLRDVLEKEVEARFFLSQGYLETLERHRIRQKSKGYGFGYRIVNDPSIEYPIANTLLATGGSGRERNLIFDPENGKKYSGMQLKGKLTEINNKSIRMMTPTEWGRLQGFIGYGFVDEDGNDAFSFPEGVSNTQLYKQFGNSVTIPVIEEMAVFMLSCIQKMVSEFNPIENRLYSMYGDEFLMCRKMYFKLKGSARETTINTYFDCVFHFGMNREFRNAELARYLKVTSARASQILAELMRNECVAQNPSGKYCFLIN